MAEFVKTMKDWMRMCEHCDRNEKIGCVVNGSVCAGFRKMIDEIDLEVVEAKVTAWAAEHPEPVYPTWGEWLEKQGVVKTVLSPRYEENGASYYTSIYEITNPIPADIAEKLELQPKEVDGD